MVNKVVDGINYVLQDDGTLVIRGSGVINSQAINNTWLDFPNHILTEYKDKIEAVVIEPGITGIGDSVFEGLTKLKSIKIPETVTWLGETVLAACSSLEELWIPDSVTKVGSGAFMECSSLKKARLSPQIDNICSSTFEDCGKLEEVEMPDNIYLIELFAFSGCVKLKDMYLQEPLNYIGNHSFEDSGITKIHLPKTVKYIGMWAFDCPCLEEIYYDGTKEDWDKIEIDGDGLSTQIPGGTKIHFKDGSLEIWGDSHKFRIIEPPLDDIYNAIYDFIEKHRRL